MTLQPEKKINMLYKKHETKCHETKKDFIFNFGFTLFFCFIVGKDFTKNLRGNPHFTAKKTKKKRKENMAWYFVIFTVAVTVAIQLTDFK